MRCIECAEAQVIKDRFLSGFIRCGVDPWNWYPAELEHECLKPVSKVPAERIDVRRSSLKKLMDRDDHLIKVLKEK